MAMLLLLLLPLPLVARAQSSSSSPAPAEQDPDTEPLWRQPPGLGLRALLWSNRGPIRHLAAVARKAASRFIRSLGTEIKEYTEEDGRGPPAGRRKNERWPLLAAGLIMGGTLLTIGLGALAAMSGKALMSAMLALGMSLMSAFRVPPRRCRRSDSGCSDDDSSRYEIIARPVITHGHTHSAVLHHDPAPAYPGYVRSLAQGTAAEQVAASLSETSSSTAIRSEQSSSSDLGDFARSGSTRLAGSGSGSSYDSYQSDGAWSGGLLGMKSPPSSDSVLNLTLGTWGQGKHPLANSQPRALGSHPPPPPPHNSTHPLPAPSQ